MPEQEHKKRKYGGRGGGGGGRGAGEGGDKPNKKSKYFTQSKGGSGQAVPLSSQGILVTCDAGREDRAGDEAVALIEEHYDKLTDPEAAKAAPPPAADAPKGAAGEEAAGEEDKADGSDAKGKSAADDAQEGSGAAGGAGGSSKDIAALLAEEMAQLKDKKAARFRLHHTGVKGCIFVIFPSPSEPGAPSPVDVAKAIAKEAQERKQVRGRHVVRFLPVTLACFASLDEIRAAAPKLVAPYFPEDLVRPSPSRGEADPFVENEAHNPAMPPGEDVTPVEFAVDYEHRSAEGFDRLDVINAFTAAIKTPPHKVNLGTPSKVVLVQLIRNGCAMAVVDSYRELAKYNVRRLAEVEEGV